MNKPLYVFYLLFGCIFLFSSCQKVYDTIPIEVDVFLGEQFSKQLLIAPAEGEIADSMQYLEVYEYLHHIKNNILQSPHVRYKDDFVWKIQLIENDSVLNAFCVAGGYIFVYTGLLKYLDNEAQLAGVMAHEIAHADCRHTTVRMVKQYGLSLIISLTTGSDGTFLVNIIQNLIGLSFSRADEKQADEMAVTYLYATPYDPRAVGGFFKKIVSEKKESAVPEFLSTHPASENRIADIENKWRALGGKTGEWFPESHEKIKQKLLHAVE